MTQPTTQMKQCPRCRTICPLRAEFCVHCGRQFQTHIPPAEERTTFGIPAPSAAPMNETGMVWAVVGVIFFGLWTSAQLFGIAFSVTATAGLGLLGLPCAIPSLLLGGGGLAASLLKVRRLYAGGDPERRGRFTPVLTTVLILVVLPSAVWLALLFFAVVTPAPQAVDSPPPVASPGRPPNLPPDVHYVRPGDPPVDVGPRR